MLVYTCQKYHHRRSTKPPDITPNPPHVPFLFMHSLGHDLFYLFIYLLTFIFLKIN